MKDIFINFGLSSVYGIFATIPMTIIGFITYKKWGLRGSLELFESQRIYEIIFRKGSKYDLTSNALIIHLVNGWLLGIPFLLLIYQEMLPSNLIILGLLYGLAVWILTLATVHKYLTKDSIISHPLGLNPVILSVLGHLIYGFVLSFLINFVGFISV